MGFYSIHLIAITVASGEAICIAGASADNTIVMDTKGNYRKLATVSGVLKSNVDVSYSYFKIDIYPWLRDIDSLKGGSITTGVEVSTENGPGFAGTYDIMNKYNSNITILQVSNGLPVTLPVDVYLNFNYTWDITNSIATDNNYTDENGYIDTYGFQYSTKPGIW